MVSKQADLMLLDAIWQQFQQRLEVEKQRIFEEIRQYPLPIPACDAQYNSLLEERVAVLQELGQVKGVLKQSVTVSEHMELLNEFVLSSRYLDSEVEGGIRQLMTKLSGADQRVADASDQSRCAVYNGGES